MKRLEEKIAIVFGAGPNIGGTIAHFLAREGARVAVSDINPDAARKTTDFITGRGYEAIALAGDAMDETAVERIVGDTVARYGGLDIIVNMAGKVHWSSVLDMELDAWREAVLSFPTAGMLTTKHAAKAMIAGGRAGGQHHPSSVDRGAFRRGIGGGLLHRQGRAVEPGALGGDGSRP